MTLDATERFSWMGVAFAVPLEWELTSIKEARGAWRATFADRRHERLSVQWRTVAARPRIEPMVAAALEEDESHPAPLRGLPPDWVGLRSSGPRGEVEHLASFLKEAQLLIEAVLVTPEGVPRQEPKGLLTSIGPQDRAAGGLVWQAMGMLLTAPPEYRIKRFDSQPGDTTWHLERPQTAEGELFSVRRIAMPSYWLRDSLEAWLRRRPPVDAREQGLERCLRNGHEGFAMLTRQRRGLASHWRRRYNLRRDLAWRCSAEERVFHVSRSLRGRGEVPPLPSGFGVSCCRVPYLRRRARGGRRLNAARSGAENALDAVPCLRQDAGVTRHGAFASVTVALKRSWLRRPPVNWLLPTASERRVRLDAVGTRVLELCDGGNSVEEIVELFAAEHRLSFREGQVAVAQFLQSLVAKGIVTLRAGRG